MFSRLLLTGLALGLGNARNGGSSTQAFRRRLSTDVTVQATEIRKLVPSDGAADVGFGKSVSTSGSNLVVGASGSAYAYRTTDGGASWSFIQKLEGFGGRTFGYSVAVSGSNLVVGAYGVKSAYIYSTTNDGASWQFVQKLSAPDGEFPAEFGQSVAMSGSAVVVGAQYGIAYVYRAANDSATWSFVQKLIAPDGAAPYDYFGNAVSVSGSNVAVGTQVKQAVYLYRSNDDGESWAFVQTLVPLTDSSFGFSISLDGENLAVGAYGSGASVGSAYMFRMNDVGNWTFSQNIVALDGADFDRFGYAVSLSGSYLAVGATGVDFYTGRVYIYGKRGDEASWIRTAELSASDGAESEYFGVSVSMSGSSVVVGTVWGDAAYIYQIANCGTMVMSDSGGNGWNGAFYSFTSASTGDTVVSGTLDDGFVGSDRICLQDGPYVLQVYGGVVDSEVSWSYATLEGSAPFGPLELEVRNGFVSVSTPAPTWAPTTTPVPTPAPTTSTPTTPVATSSGGGGGGGLAIGLGVGMTLGALLVVLLCALIRQFGHGSESKDDDDDKEKTATTKSKDDDDAKEKAVPAESLDDDDGSKDNGASRN